MTRPSSGSGQVSLPRAIALAHRFASERLRAGDTAVDATAGNGHDTAFLAEQTAPGGRVVAFDRQQAALDAAARRCSEWPHVRFRLGCHGEMENHLAPSEARIVMFNLGYLPGGDKSLTTEAATTIRALEAALNVLADGGLVTVVSYAGHAGGEEERRRVDSWCRSLDQDRFAVAHYGFVNQRNHPPDLFLIEKKSGAGKAGR